jgi:hypothetical protein
MDEMKLKQMVLFDGINVAQGPLQSFWTHLITTIWNFVEV